jgi:hypothetical protein
MLEFYNFLEKKQFVKFKRFFGLKINKRLKNLANQNRKNFDHG